jgi:uncharacterized protein YneF (UPF0154 family)
MKNAIFFIFTIVILLICLSCNTTISKESVKDYLDVEDNYKYLNRIVRYSNNQDGAKLCENRIKQNENVIFPSPYSQNDYEFDNHPFADQSKLIKTHKEFNPEYVGFILRFRSVDSLAFSYG